MPKEFLTNGTVIRVPRKKLWLCLKCVGRLKESQSGAGPFDFIGLIPLNKFGVPVLPQRDELTITRDQDPPNPREYSVLGIMACWHRRYKLGDVQPKEDPKEWLKQNAPEGSVVLPLYLMDHSGLSIKTQPFTEDPSEWDSGQVGFIVVTPEAIKKAYDVENATPDICTRARESLLGEVSVYDQYLRGSCWGYEAKVGDKEDSCWGFFGDSLEETGLKESVPAEALPLLEAAWESRRC
jgi:hypothetical protein